VDRAIEASRFRHVGEQIFDRIRADCPEHVLPVGFGEREITHPVSS
jgi:hypothetical protein